MFTWITERFAVNRWRDLLPVSLILIAHRINCLKSIFQNTYSLISVNSRRHNPEGFRGLSQGRVFYEELSSLCYVGASGLAEFRRASQRVQRLGRMPHASARGSPVPGDRWGSRGAVGCCLVCPFYPWHNLISPVWVLWPHGNPPSEKDLIMHQARKCILQVWRYKQ